MYSVMGQLHNLNGDLCFQIYTVGSTTTKSLSSGIFFATSHGKDVVDGIRGTVKKDSVEEDSIQKSHPTF